MLAPAARIRKTPRANGDELTIRAVVVRTYRPTPAYVIKKALVLGNRPPRIDFGVGMETRLIIAYLLIALTATVLVWAGLYANRKRREQRDIMRGRFRR